MKGILLTIVKKILNRFRYQIYFYSEKARKEELEAQNQLLLEEIPDHGKNIYFKNRVYISNPKMTLLGNNIHIGDNAFFFTDGGLIIEDNAHISRNVTIYTSNHQYEGNALPYDNSRIFKRVHIEKNVWIGMNVSIVPGVTIGEGAIIGLGTVVTKSVAPYSILGVPDQKVIKSRNIEHYNTLEKKKLYGGSSGIPLKKIRNSKSVFQLNTPPFFVVSTGRSGSKSIANILSQNKNTTCLHEAKGELIRLSNQFEYGEISNENLADQLRLLYGSIQNIETDFYGESDQKISNLIAIYKDIIPNSKFVWLIREPKDSINSMYIRNWFRDEDFENIKSIPEGRKWGNYALNRIDGSRIKDEFTIEEWKNLDPFERVCWYWLYWNSKIKSQLSSIGDKNKFKLRLSEIEKNQDRLNSFLGIEKQKYNIQHLNKADQYSDKNWNESQVRIYEKYKTDCESLYSESL